MMAATSPGTRMDGIEFEPGAYPEVWLVKQHGQPCGAVGFAPGDGRWRAAWRGNLVGDSCDTREEAVEILIDLKRHRELAQEQL
jgi:hypothetical protein